MNDTENYLYTVRASLKTRLAVSFGLYLGVTVLSFALSYLLLGNTDAGKYMIACDVSGGGFFAAVRSAVLSQSQAVFMLVVLYLTAFSTLCPISAGLVCAWRGASLGAVIALISTGSVGGFGSGWRGAVLVYFAASVCIIILAAITSLYSSVMTYSYGIGEKKIFRSLWAEYTKCYLMASGSIFLTGCAAALLI